MNKVIVGHNATEDHYVLDLLMLGAADQDQLAMVDQDQDLHVEDQDLYVEDQDLHVETKVLLVIELDLVVVAQVQTSMLFNNADKCNLYLLEAKVQHAVKGLNLVMDRLLVVVTELHLHHLTDNTQHIEQDLRVANLAKLHLNNSTLNLITSNCNVVDILATNFSLLVKND